MKRIYYFATLLVLAATPALTTSCDDDPWYDDYYGDWYDKYDWYDNAFEHSSGDLLAMAQTLNGVWTGQIVNEYTDDNGQRQKTRMEVDFTFTQYSGNSNNGVGTETDYVQRYDDNGNPVRDNKGNIVYDSQTLNFKWYVDPRTYNINIEYEGSGYRFLLDINGNSEYSGFSLSRDSFNGVMEGINNDEYVFFDCQRVNVTSAPAKGTTTLSNKSFGKQTSESRVDSSVPMALRRR